MHETCQQTRRCTQASASRVYDYNSDPKKLRRFLLAVWFENFPLRKSAFAPKPCTVEAKKLEIP